MPTPPTVLPYALRKIAASSPLAPDMATVDRFVAQCHRHRYPGKTEVFRPGDPGNTLYYVISGSLSIISEETGGRELVLSYINAGDFIGEMGLFVVADHREVQLRTRSSCELAEIDYERLQQLLTGPLAADAPRILYAIGAQLSRRLLETSRKASRLAFLDVTGRIMRSLYDLCTQPQAVSHPKGAQLHMSRQELARNVGCSREMAGRVLKKLQQEGKLEAQGMTITVFTEH